MCLCKSARLWITHNPRVLQTTDKTVLIPIKTSLASESRVYHLPRRRFLHRGDKKCPESFYISLKEEKKRGKTTFRSEKPASDRGCERASSACCFLTVWSSGSLGGRDVRPGISQSACITTAQRRKHQWKCGLCLSDVHVWPITSHTRRPSAPPAVSTATSGLSGLVCGPREELRRLSASRGAQNTEL